MVGRAEELDTPPSDGFDPVGTVEMTLSHFGTADFHGAIDEISRAAADIGGEYFYVTNPMGHRITATVYRRKPRSPRSRRRG
ncbi:hypothetical protein [Nocardia transvalensis]|uniref:hypothetical protein n=1 Tax=Nocardia transvalensis TaxID=37333 RepID=UPI001895C8DB|nr:hypothetical protein [Nocardia transvalensis]MBF6330774.1 hypothetical protein [Nocardia transvalensis]